MDSLHKLAISFLLNPSTTSSNTPRLNTESSGFLSRCDCSCSSGLKKEDPEDPVYTLLHLKNFILQQQHQHLHSSPQDQLVASSTTSPSRDSQMSPAAIATTTTTTTTTTRRSSLVFLDSPIPSLLPDFVRAKDTSTLPYPSPASSTSSSSSSSIILSPMLLSSSRGDLCSIDNGHYNNVMIGQKRKRDTTINTESWKSSPKDHSSNDEEDEEAEDDDDEEEEPSASSGSGDDEINHPTPSSTSALTRTTTSQKPKKRRVRPTKEQASYLEKCFKENAHPDTPARHKIAEMIRMHPKTVCTWFQNKRARTKRALKRPKREGGGPQATMAGKLVIPSIHEAMNI